MRGKYNKIGITKEKVKNLSQVTGISCVKGFSVLFFLFKDGAMIYEFYLTWKCIVIFEEKP